MMELKTKFENFRESFHKENQFLYSAIYILKELQKSVYFEGKKIAPAFFYITSFALYSNIIIWTEKLFGRRAENGWMKFLNFIEQNRKVIYPKPYISLSGETWSISEDDIRNDKKTVTDWQDSTLLGNVDLLRDKYFAHFDKKHFFDQRDLFQNNIIDYEGLIELVKSGDELLMKYSLSYDGIFLTLEPVNIDDITKLLQFIIKQKEKCKAEATAELKQKIESLDSKNKDVQN